MTALRQPDLWDAPTLGSPFEVHQESKRRLSNRAKVLQRLQQGPATTLELIEVGGTRAPARVWELKTEDGYDIDVDDLGRGKFRYTLRGRGGDQGRTDAR